MNTAISAVILSLILPLAHSEEIVLVKSAWDLPRNPDEGIGIIRVSDGSIVERRQLDLGADASGSITSFELCADPPSLAMWYSDRHNNGFLSVLPLDKPRNQAQRIKLPFDPVIGGYRSSYAEITHFAIWQYVGKIASLYGIDLASNEITSKPAIDWSGAPINRRGDFGGGVAIHVLIDSDDGKIRQYVGEYVVPEAIATAPDKLREMSGKIPKYSHAIVYNDPARMAITSLDKDNDKKIVSILDKASGKWAVWIESGFRSDVWISGKWLVIRHRYQSVTSNGSFPNDDLHYTFRDLSSDKAIEWNSPNDNKITDFMFFDRNDFAYFTRGRDLVRSHIDMNILAIAPSVTVVSDESMPFVHAGIEIR